MSGDNIRPARQKQLTVAGICAVIITILFVASVWNIFISSDDSISNYIYARLTDPSFSWKQTFDFQLMRGRVGIVFPLVIMLRDSVFRSGDLIAVRIMQFLPVVINVYAAAFFIGKKTKIETGIMFVIMFFSLLQVTGWHNLVICYPLDFMYGLLLAQTALYLFSDSVQAEKAGPIRTLMICLLFYESLQVYEAFLLFITAYVWVSRRANKSISKTIKRLIPVLAVSVVYIMVGLALRIHPVVEVPDGYINTLGTVGRFFPTLAIFSLGLLPMSSVVFPSVKEGITFSNIDLRIVVMMLLAAAGVYCALSASGQSDEKIKDKTSYITLGVTGGMIAISFPMLHALISRYQEWAIEGHQLGYVPTLISYFGWITLIVSFISLYASRGGIPNSIKLLISAAIGVITLATGLINISIRNGGIGPASPEVSYKAQAVIALAANSDFAQENCDLMLMRGYDGVHGEFLDYTYLIGHETENGVEIRLTGSEEEYRSLSGDCDHPGIFEFDPSTGEGIFTREDGSKRVQVFISR